ncbi:GGDEF domain-containing protein [Moritella sp. Urea-trap-13]|uniref:GGDEF domain-containing protein n=1 Tax=Moritella sp. Urea-trap-13 TaxID=2058327 RepID=UPI000C32F381|nr:GGDEF domain-containing protein [Moritella sp. Urea-trap-13]PKH07055.1 GGDEF domain-containing protein [Moritella sp. Urea-trap-13]
MSLMHQVIQSFPGLMAVKKLTGEHVVVNESYKGFFPFDVHGLTLDDIIDKIEDKDVIDLLLQCKANDAAALAEPDKMKTSIETFLDTSFESVRYIMQEGGDEFMALLSWDITEKVNTANKLNARLQHDDLTGIANKSALMQRTFNNNNTVVYLDLDNFKRINDTFGHLKGDEMLIKFALFINNQLRDKDTIYRVGGDEFVLVFENVSEAKIEQRLSRIRSCVEQDGDFLGMSFSFGMRAMQQDISLAGALDIADKQLYINKKKRRNLRV